MAAIAGKFWGLFTNPFFSQEPLDLNDKIKFYIDMLKNKRFTLQQLLEILSFIKNNRLNRSNMDTHNELNNLAGEAYKKHLTEITTQFLDKIQKNIFQPEEFLNIIDFVYKASYFDNKFLQDYIEIDLYNCIVRAIKIKSLEILRTNLKEAIESKAPLSLTTAKILKYVSENVDRLFFSFGNEKIKAKLPLKYIADKVNVLSPEDREYFDLCLFTIAMIPPKNISKLILSVHKGNKSPQEQIKIMQECIPMANKTFVLKENDLIRLGKETDRFKSIIGKMLFPMHLPENQLRNDPTVLSVQLLNAIDSLIKELKSLDQEDEVYPDPLPNAIQV